MERQHCIQSKRNRRSATFTVATMAVVCLTLSCIGFPRNCFSADSKVVFVVANPSSVSPADTLIAAYIRDSLLTSTGGSFLVEYMDDLEAHNQRMSQPWWDSVGASIVLWSSNAFGSYNISGINVPVLLFNANALGSFNLGTKLNAVATTTWINQHNHWITATAPGDTLFPINNANLSVGQVVGARGGDLQSLVLAKESPGLDTACMVAVDSGALLQDGVTVAPNRRVYSGFTNASLWTWSHGWDVLFTRSFYWLLGDTTNAIVHNRVRITDHLLATTWFEIGSCDMAVNSDGGTVRTGQDSGENPAGLVRYDSLARYIPAPPTGLKIRIDSVNFSMHLRKFTAYNIQGVDSGFDVRIYAARIRRQVKFNQGTSTYTGATCGVNDTASVTNHWCNRFAPAYPSISRHLWPATLGNLVTDSVWKQPGARDTTLDIFPWRPQDTLRENKILTPPDSWTRFPVNPAWFQKWVDSPSVNYGFALETDTVYNTANIEMNHVGHLALPTTNDAPRLTLYWSYITDIGTDVDEGADDEAGTVLPTHFKVHQNFPNPFNPTTVISYSLPVKANVAVSIYNVLGQTVKTFAQGEQSAGTYSVTWDATDSHGAEVASGMYFYKVTAGEFSASRKMVLLK